MAKYMKRIVFLCVTFVILLALSGEPAYAAAKPKLSKSNLYLSVGSKKTLTVKNTSSGAKRKWSSSNKRVATVSGKGVVKAVKKGTSTITCKVPGKSLKCKVTVVAKDLTGYKTKRFTWKREDTESYAMKYFAAGKYVRADGKAVLYIDGWDTGEGFTYEIFVKSGSAALSDYSDPGRDRQYATAELEGNKVNLAKDNYSYVIMKDNGKHVITITTDWIDDLYYYYAVPHGKYYLVRAK